MRNQRILLRQLVARYPRFASVSSRSFSTLIKAGRFHSRKTRKTQSCHLIAAPDRILRFLNYIKILAKTMTNRNLKAK